MSKTVVENKHNSSLLLTNKSPLEFREELKKYFISTYELYEKLFLILDNKDIMYKQANKFRQPLIFYYGHTATFFINKMLVAKLIDKRVNKKFENIFAIGVDEMKWDDLNQNNYEWPKIEEIQEYRNKVKDVVLESIDKIDITFPINYDSDAWIILMGIEHENIHLETSSVLIRELDIEYVKEHKDFLPYNTDTNNTYPSNELLQVDGGELQLGVQRKNPMFYAWDNEFGTYATKLNDFMASKYLVSNGEFLEFINDGGYDNDSYWSDESKKWRGRLKNPLPHFWIKKDDKYYLREIFRIIPLPLNYPAEVNHYEAKAFCKYKSEKENIEIRLPSEDEYYKLRDFCEPENKNANINLEFLSSCPIDKYEHKGFYDVMGNVWQWSDTPIYPFEGFEPHVAYDDFSMPTFDDKHFLLKGGSFISRGNETTYSSRYAFREYFFQHCGFRYVQSSNIVDTKKNNNTYESHELSEQYCEFHYGNNYFGVENFMKKSISIISKIVKENNIPTNKAMDLGCSVGRASFELAKTFDEVTGIDFSANFINVALKLLENKRLDFNILKEGNIKERKEVSLESLNINNLKGKTQFFQGDACNLKSIFSGYDVIFCSNLIDRLYEPYSFLESIQDRLNKGGLLIISSPYTWLEEYTPQEKWLGGYKKNGKEIYTIDTLKSKLDNFELLHTEDVEFVIRETKRKFQHSVSQMSVWKKNI